MTKPHRVIARLRDLTNNRYVEVGEMWTPRNDQVAERLIRAGCLERPPREPVHVARPPAPPTDFMKEGTGEPRPKSPSKRRGARKPKMH